MLRCNRTWNLHLFNAIVLLLLVPTNTLSQSQAVPRLVRFSGKLTAPSTTNQSRVMNLTFLLFAESEGGTPLWSERQNIPIDENGCFEALLGANTAEGLPVDLFVSGQARWLAIRTEDGIEQPRQLLTSAPYAVKAFDATTLGGHPVSSFLLQEQFPSSGAIKSRSDITLKASVVVNPGTANYLAKFVDPSTVSSSSVVETSTGVGLDVAAPTQRFDVFGRMKLRARGSATSGLWFTDSTGNEQLFFGQVGLDSASPLGIWHGGAWRVAMSNAGDLGIGVGITPSARLDVGGRAVFRASTQGSSGFWLTSADGVRTLFVGQKGITSADAFGIWHNGAWRFSVDKSGNVGIGVDPLFRLDVLGRMRLRASGSQPSGSWFSGESDTPQLFVGQTDVMASAPFGIMHGGNWRFLLRSDGKIGIGTTTPTELLEVAGNLKLSAGGKLIFPDGTSMLTAGSGSVSSITSTDPALLVTTTGQTTELSLTNGGIGTAKLADGSITAAKLSGPLPPSLVAGIAATLGANSFVGSQNIQGSLAVTDQLHVQNLSVLAQTLVSYTNPIDASLIARNNATTGDSNAILAQTSSPTGVAIAAVTMPTSGSAMAINATSNSPAGKGVYAEASNAIGLNVGVHGVSRSSQGTGVRGEALGNTGPTYGVVGTSNAENSSAAVYAQNNGNGTNSASYGVYARAQGSWAAGVFAYASNLSGNTYGVYGRVDSPNGIAGMFKTSASSGTVISAENATRRIFRLDTAGNVFALGTFNPNGADFAESVAVRGTPGEYTPGDVLVIDPDHDRQFYLSNEAYSLHVAGIFSTKPGVLGTKHSLDPQSEEIPLAMIGIVPCHVTTENGPIQRGDILVTSSRPGYAMRGNDRSKLAGAVVGKALQSLEQGSGTIEVMVTLQ